MNTLKSTQAFIRKTFINGIVFLVPVVAIGWLSFGAVSGAVQAFIALDKNEHIQKAGGLLLLLPLCLLAILVLVFLTGILVHFTFLVRVKDWLENQVLNMIPSYDLAKSMMEERLHIKNNRGDAVLVNWAESNQLGLLVEVDNEKRACTVFFPNSSITGGGSLHIVSIDKVTLLNISLNELDNIFNRSGKGLLAHYRGL